MTQASEKLACLPTGQKAEMKSRSVALPRSPQSQVLILRVYR